MTTAYDTGGRNQAFIWGYINEYKTGRRIIWVMEGYCVPYGTIVPFEGVVDDFGTIVKKP